MVWHQQFSFISRILVAYNFFEVSRHNLVSVWISWKWVWFFIKFSSFLLYGVQ